MEKEKQIRGWIQKQKRLISEAPDQTSRDYIAMMWLGFLNGMRITNAITWAEYNGLYDEIQQFIAGMEAA